jgi:hypothetical protein
LEKKGRVQEKEIWVQSEEEKGLELKEEDLGVLTRIIPPSFFLIYKVRGFCLWVEVGC